MKDVYKRKLLLRCEAEINHSDTEYLGRISISHDHLPISNFFITFKEFVIVTHKYSILNLNMIVTIDCYTSIAPNLNYSSGFTILAMFNSVTILIRRFFTLLVTITTRSRDDTRLI